MAGGDDDDFTFASFPSTTNNLTGQFMPHQIKGANLTSISTNQGTDRVDDDDDDDWGDFVKSPLGSGNYDQHQPSRAPAHTQSKSLDHFSFWSESVSSNSSGSKAARVKVKGPVGSSNDDQQPSSAPAPSQLKLLDPFSLSTGPQAAWEKVKGPLPLSLFGDVEDEEEVKGSNVNDVQGANGMNLVAKAVVNVSPPSSSASSKSGFNDIIANLYSYNYASTPASTATNNDNIIIDNNGMTGEKGSTLYRSGSNLSEKDSIMELNGFNFSSDFGDVKRSSDETVKNSDEISINANSSGSNVDENAVGGFNFSGLEEEFRGFSSNSNMRDQSKQGNAESYGFSFDSNRLVSNVSTSTSNVDALNFNFGGWDLVSNGVSADSGKLNYSDGLNSSTASKAVSLDGKNGELDGYGDDGDYDDGWEFKGAFSGQNARDGNDQVGSETHEPFNINTYSSGFGSGSDKPVNLSPFSDALHDLFPMSSGVSTDSCKVGKDLNTVLSKAAPIYSTSDDLFRSEPIVHESQLDSNVAVGDEKTEDFGEFTAAFSGIGRQEETDLKVNDISASGIELTTSVGMDQVERKFDQNSHLDAYTSSTGNGSSRVFNLFSMSNGSLDLFSMSNAINDASLGLHPEFDAMSSKSAETVVTSPTHKDNVQESCIDGSYPHSVLEKRVENDDFGDIAAAFQEAGPVREGKLKASDNAQSELQESSTGLGKYLENGTSDGNNKGALPLSIFGDEKLEVDLDIQNAFVHSHSTVEMNGQRPKSFGSIDDLILNLYSQAEQNAPVGVMKSTTDIELSPTTESKSEPLHNADGDNEESWEYKNSSTKEDPDIKSPSVSPEVAGDASPCKVRLNYYVEFYSKLKDNLFLITKCHLKNLKKVDDNGKVMAQDEEIQDVLKDFDQEAAINQEGSLEGHATRDVSLHEILEALKDPKLEILESEYGLSERLSLAEKDLRSALELKKHAETMLKLLHIGSFQDHLMYVTIWSKMMSVCARELQCGAKVLKRSLEMNVKNDLFSETRGKEFIKALGEIYRVAMVLSVSVRLYKPWTFECTAESTQIYALLDECQNVWLSSGLGEALSDMLHLHSFESNNGLATLVESIQYIDNLDVFVLKDHVFTQAKSRCQLSLICSETIPGLKVVDWDGEQYFVKLANLWANLISCDPPKVPQLHEALDEKAD